MILRRVVINNLFCYNGRVTYEFQPANGAGNVVLVVGRNGYGKTSLLNAVKLLFLGPDDRKQRQVGFPPRNLSRSDYVLGTAAWWGIMNRAARAAGDDVCSIRIELGTTEAVTFIAERSWHFYNGSFEEDAYVATDGREYRNDSADERLGELLPRELVPFFFFDGEELQFLAETSDDQRADAMERLLSLSYITGVETQLAETIKMWRREAMPLDIQAQIAQVEGEISTLNANLVAERQRRDACGRELAEAVERADAQKRRMEAMRAAGSSNHSGRLDEDIASLERELESDFSDLAYAITSNAPLLANPGLVRATRAPLEDIIDRKTRSAESVFDHVFSVLPERLFGEPPQPRIPLTDEQQRFFTSKMRRILDAFAVEDQGTPPLLGSLDLARARQLRERFLGLEAGLAVLRQDRARRLKEVSRKRQRLEDLKAERREVEFGSAERADAYRRQEEGFVELQRKIGSLEKDLDQHDRKIAEVTRQEGESKSKLAALERKHHSATRISRRLEIAIGLRDSFVAYRGRSRASRRQQIEDVINQHFSRLMSGHRLVEHIRIDDDFFMHFVDVEGREVGHLTISHGMRQLAVTALLWALKDVSGRNLPIIVDTPLARIDRDNQRNLLEKYYPHAAEQVIILATDSEIDAGKFELLRPHLGAHFRLENPDGQSTRVIREDLPHG